MSTNIDQQFVEYIVKSLVSRDSDVSVERSIDQKGVLLTLTVHPDDLGRVIGRRGTTAQSLRTLLRALGTKNDARYNLKIVDTDNVERDAPKNADEEPAEEASPEASEAENSSNDTEREEESGNLTKKTRKDLAEYDDLDI